MAKVGQQVGYRRVSSEEQNLDRQLDGVDLDEMFEDRASGKSADRPQLQAMLKHVRAGDEVVVHSLDRLARNLTDLLDIVNRLTKRGVKVRFLKEGLTFSGNDDPMSRLMLGMLGAVSEFERALIRERQKEGISLAKRKGVYKGRKPSLTPAQADQLRMRAAAGEKKSALAREFKVSRETLYAYLRAPRSLVGAQGPDGGEGPGSPPPRRKEFRPDRISDVIVKKTSAAEGISG